MNWADMTKDERDFYVDQDKVNMRELPVGNLNANFTDPKIRSPHNWKELITAFSIDPNIIETLTCLTGLEKAVLRMRFVEGVKLASIASKLVKTISIDGVPIATERMSKRVLSATIYTAKQKLLKEAQV
jgi:hypothetical protein